MIYLTGDVHGHIDLVKFKTWKEKENLTKNDYLIIVGDFGAVWYGDERDSNLLNWHDSQPYTTLFIDGNHENFDALYQYPVEIWNGGKIHRIRKRVIHLERGQVFNIDGKTFFTFDGASSVDKTSRTPFKSWWPQEMPNQDEMSDGITALEQHDNKVDYILTHAAPYHIIKDELKYPVSNEDYKFATYLEDLESSVDFKDWYFGHYHNDEDYGKLHLMYDRIIQL